MLEFRYTPCNVAFTCTLLMKCICCRSRCLNWNLCVFLFWDVYCLNWLGRISPHLFVGFCCWFGGLMVSWVYWVQRNYESSCSNYALWVLYVIPRLLYWIFLICGHCVIALADLVLGGLDSKHRMQCYSFVFNEFNIIRNFHLVKMPFRCLILILTGYIKCFWSCCLCIWSFSSWWVGLKTQIAVFCFCMYWIQCILEFPCL